MSRRIKVMIGLCLIAAAVFGTVELARHYEADGRSPYEKLEDDLEQGDGRTGSR